MKKLLFVFVIPFSLLFTVNNSFGSSSTTFHRMLPSLVAGDPNSLFVVGEMYFHGQYVKPSYQKAYDSFRQAGKQGHYSARISADILIYLSNKKLDLNLDSLIKKAKENDSLAQFYLSEVYGRGLLWLNESEDKVKAKKWLKASSDNGYYQAQLNMCSNYQDKSKFDDALNVIAKMDKPLSGDVSYMLYNLYGGYLGFGVCGKVDPSKSYEAAKDGVEQNNIRSILALAYFYYLPKINESFKGEPKQDKKKGLALFEKAASLGSFDAKRKIIEINAGVF